MNTRRFLTGLLLVLFTMSFANAQPGPGKNRGQFPPRPERGERMAEMLDLTDAQQQQIEKIRLEHLKEMESIRSELQKLRSEYRLLLVADSYDRNKIKQKLAEISSVREKQELERADHFAEIRKMLTDEQKVKFDQFILSRGPGDRGKHFGRRPYRGPRNWDND
jgi:Spy/CpxP family protein refolding chaperone